MKMISNFGNGILREKSPRPTPWHLSDREMPEGKPGCSKKEEEPEELVLFEWANSRSPSPVYDLEKAIEVRNNKRKKRSASPLANSTRTKTKIVDGSTIRKNNSEGAQSRLIEKVQKFRCQERNNDNSFDDTEHFRPAIKMWLEWWAVEKEAEECYLELELKQTMRIRLRANDLPVSTMSQKQRAPP